MIRISDQHFSLGDPRELAVNIMKPTRRKAGLQQFSVYEILRELAVRPFRLAKRVYAQLRAKIAQRRGNE